ncbi:MAG: hypothetical protein LBG48_03955, partial [Rickettsiales bacterium]|nr:hypothetical protein [Rickettsiales bacterium]
MDNYKKILKIDSDNTKEYFLKSVYEKTQQQLFLEKLLKDENHDKNYKIADVACGGGGLSYHLK